MMNRLIINRVCISEPFLSIWECLSDDGMRPYGLYYSEKDALNFAAKVRLANPTVKIVQVWTFGEPHNWPPSERPVAYTTRRKLRMRGAK